MGCSFSRPSGPNVAFPGRSGAHSSTTASHAINTTAHAGATRRRRHHHHHSPLDQPPNQPLQRHRWASASSPRRTTAAAPAAPWTRAALDAERAAFFDTRVAGRPEVWQALRAALQVLWAADRWRAGGLVSAAAASGPRGGGNAEDGFVGGGGGSGEDAGALATAQSVLDAADVTLPTGDLADGAYDAQGNYYQLPGWVVSDPVDLEADGEAGGLRASEERAGEGDGGGDGGDGGGGGGEVERRREEKGKGVADRGAQVTVVMRLSDTGRDLRMHVGKEETVASVLRRLREKTGHPPTSLIRLVHLGKILRDNASLAAQGWEKGQVLSAFVNDVPDREAQARNGATG